MNGRDTEPSAIAEEPHRIYSWEDVRIGVYFISTSLWRIILRTLNMHKRPIAIRLTHMMPLHAVIKAELPK